MAKKKRKPKKENTDLERIKILEERLNEIRLKWHAMTDEEQKIVAEARAEINHLNKK